MRGKKHVVIDKEGKEVEYHVNRVWKHEPWDNMHPDTITILDGKPPPVPREQPVGKEQKSKEDVRLEVGEMIIYPKQMEEPDCLPFGLGRIVEIKEDFVCLQRYGNAQYSPKGFFWPAWIDPKDTKVYFRKSSEDD